SRPASSAPKGTSWSTVASSWAGPARSARAVSAAGRGVEEAGEPRLVVRADGEDLEHAGADPLAVAGAAHLLHVQMNGRHRVDVGHLPGLDAHGGLALPHAVPPLRVEVPETEHLEVEDRLQLDLVCR